MLQFDIYDLRASTINPPPPERSCCTSAKKNQASDSPWISHALEHCVSAASPLGRRTEQSSSLELGAPVADSRVSPPVGRIDSVSRGGLPLDELPE
ncbi:hypothetical protein AAFF_G00098630 [Aldrovandia affinis]|uniref:Uncharacterized protein n=1 Tax=Aldrovandia affinis TaxID=143900 RepID=A0AAD7WBT9_9TELE|nr:hypothetical protein AAFF_G00098630 [Aldrovandia affinis]